MKQSKILIRKGNIFQDDEDRRAYAQARILSEAGIMPPNG